MAELHVQPKRNSYWWIWLLLAIIIIGGALYYYFNYYQKGKTLGGPAMNDSTASTTTSSSDTSAVAAGDENLWDQVDFNSPDTTYPEVKDKNITTKSNAHFVIYSLPDHQLFAGNSSDLSKDGRQRLNEVGSSINQRFRSAEVKVYDRSDTTHRDTLAEHRAQTVSNYLVQNSKLDQDRVTVYEPQQQSGLPKPDDKVNIIVKR
jgi:flagellar motor protein MotB